MTQFRRPGNAKAFRPGILANAIKGFNHEWAAITSIRDMRTRDIIGWKLQTECGVERKFPNGHWDDPYGAAVHAMENHRCGHPAAEFKFPLLPGIQERTSQHAS